MRTRKKVIYFCYLSNALSQHSLGTCHSFSVVLFTFLLNCLLFLPWFEVKEVWRRFPTTDFSFRSLSSTVVDVPKHANVSWKATTSCSGSSLESQRSIATFETQRRSRVNECCSAFFYITTNLSKVTSKHHLLRRKPRSTLAQSGLAFFVLTVYQMSDRNVRNIT